MFETTDRLEHPPLPLRQATLTAPPERNKISSVALIEPHDEPARHLQPSLYRIIWRWHFYAGVLVSPVLMVVAMTGALYIFKDELERTIYPGTMFVVPQAESISLNQQLAAVEASYPGWKADTVEVDTDTTRATSIRIRQPGQSKRVYVNPHTGAIQGAIGDDSFFRVVLTIHRQLFIGTTGRVVVELVTCWAIVLLITGLYLWFPRRRERVWGVILPRLRANPYTALRDLHAIGGALFMPIAVTIAATGLIYTLGWGSIYKYATDVTVAAAETHGTVARSVSSPLLLDEAVATVRQKFAAASFIDVQLPANPGDALVARARLGERSGPRNRAVLTLDRSTNAVISIRTSDQSPALSWWRSTWNYPLHVGSVLGTPTKVIWLFACLVLTALPITGLWMWWKRRPDGRTGFPRRSNRAIPAWLIAAIGLIGLLLPAVGATILVILAGEWICCQMQNDRRPTLNPRSV